MACAPEGLRKIAGVAQLVEHLPSKQDVASSNLVARSTVPLGVRICPYSSAVEHSLGKGEVTCSSHVMGTIFWLWAYARKVNQ